jgi:hypothetical protein
VKELQEIAKQFEVSKPIFEASLGYEGSRVEFTLKKTYRPNLAEFSDPVAKLVARRYQEVFKSNEQRFVHNIQMDCVYGDVIDIIIAFYELNSNLKNPKQSKLYKFLSSTYIKYDHPSAEGFIALYRYIKKPLFGSLPDDKKNVLAILEMMREKYE